MILKLGSLFDGAGGFPFAAKHLGIEPVWASEIEPFPIAVTRKRFPNMKHLGDVSQINGAEIEPVDVLTFGSPCQDLSVAGKRAGLDGERSGLFMEAIRIIKEMRSATNGVYPRIAVWENVPGAFSSAKGEDFRAVLEAFVQVKDCNATVPRPKSGKWADAGAIVGDGYSVAWRVLDAQYLIPQRRRRIFLVADFGSSSGAERVLFERDGLRRNFAESRASWQGITKSLAFRTPAEERTAYARTYGISSYASNAMKSPNPHSGVYEADTARCLDLNGGNPACNQGGIVIVAIEGNGSRPSHQGNGYSEDGVMYTLNTIDRHAVCYDARGNGDGSTVPTITGDHENRVTDYTALLVACNWDGGQTVPTLTARNAGGSQRMPDKDNFQAVLCVRERCGCEGGGKGLLIQDDKSGTIATSNDQFLCVALDRASYNQGANAQFDPVEISDLDGATLIPVEIILRRLTPTECARLQGMPDWYCDDIAVPDPTEEDMAFWREVFETHRRIVTQASKPKTDKQIRKWLANPVSDAAQYKMWGNGMALPCVLYVMEGIKELLEGGNNE